MPELSSKAPWLVAAWLCCVCGLAWFALAMEEHWHQVLGRATQDRKARIVLCAMGSIAVALSLAICLRTDHATMAPLVWVMLLAAAALIVALTLAWRPRWMAPLVAWMPTNKNPSRNAR